MKNEIVKAPALARLLVFAICLVAFLHHLQSEAQILNLQGDLSPIHDPSIIRQGNMYYVFATNRFQQKLLPIFCSPNLEQWKFCGNVFDAVPDWALREIPGARGIWAPDVSFVDGEYRLYYAVSTFGGNHSVIGLATNKTLDSACSEYHWVDQGLVVRSTKDDDFNAIDPAYIRDAKGNDWIAFGSFWSGIRMRRLDHKSGKLMTNDSTLYSLASRRPMEPAAIEAPAVIRHDGKYYLFVSFDLCCRGKESTYKIMVGRSEKVTGPYYDRDGKSMMEGGGTLLLQGSNNWKGPGGQSVFNDSSGDVMAFHSYSAETGKANLMIARIVWENGWPSIGELP